MQANPSHTYSVAGTFTAMLIVRDNGGGSGQTSLSISAGNRAPLVAIAAPLDESLYNAGDSITFRGSAMDPEEGQLAPSQMRWKVTFFHADHTHPFLDVTGVDTGTFVIPRTGEPSADTWYEVCLTAQDGSGLESTTCVQIRPRKVPLTFRTSPNGFTITFNGQPTQTTVTIVSVVGFDHVIGAPDQVHGSQNWTFDTWSDGGAATHTIRAPGTATTYTAGFRKR
jgi:PKD repeat protein